MLINLQCLNTITLRTYRGGRNRDKTPAERFWQKVDIRPDPECWIWTGSFTGNYGVLNINKHNAYAHRISYILHFGNFPNELQVCHKCDNPKCVNPQHLFLGTQIDNTHDAIEKGRHFTPFGKQGELSPNHKLTASDVIKIRQLRQTGLSSGKLAKMFNITKSQVNNIIYRRSWSHIP